MSWTPTGEIQLSTSALVCYDGSGVYGVAISKASRLEDSTILSLPSSELRGPKILAFLCPANISEEELQLDPKRFCSPDLQKLLGPIFDPPGAQSQTGGTLRTRPPAPPPKPAPVTKNASERRSPVRRLLKGWAVCLVGICRGGRREGCMWRQQGCTSGHRWRLFIVKLTVW